MSFLKITDPKKRDYIVNEFLKKRQIIQQNFLSEVKVKENIVIIGNKKYAGTLGLWELIVARSPDDKIFTNGIMIILLK